MKMEAFDLKKFRLDKRLTQKELAELLDCNQNFVSRIESGIRQLPQAKLDVLKENFGDISEYFTESLSVETKRADKTVLTVESLRREVTLLKEQLSEEKNRSEKYLNMIQSLINK